MGMSGKEIPTDIVNDIIMTKKCKIEIILMFKKGNMQECMNYKNTAITRIVMLRLTKLNKKLRELLEPTLEDSQQ